MPRLAEKLGVSLINEEQHEAPPTTEKQYETYLGDFVSKDLSKCHARELPSPKFRLTNVANSQSVEARIPNQKLSRDKGGVG